MAHCGYEATAVTDALKHPLKAWRVARSRFRTEGPMAPEIPLEHQRPAAHVFEQLVKQAAAPAVPASRSDEAEARRERSHAA
jgi:hypothetical protein